MKLPICTDRKYPNDNIMADDKTQSGLVARVKKRKRTHVLFSFMPTWACDQFRSLPHIQPATIIAFPSQELLVVQDVFLL
jgi:hypothetical protein